MLVEDFVREARSVQPGLLPAQLLQLVAYQEARLSDNAQIDDQTSRRQGLSAETGHIRTVISSFAGSRVRRLFHRVR